MDSHMDWHALRAALDWQVELGADEAIGETPVNRFEAAAEAVAQVAVKAAAVSAAPVPEQVDPVAVARAAARDAADLDALKAALDAFEHCDLRRGARNLVFADGTPGARVMVIGEAPGRDEDIQGKPFVGRAGQLLDRMLAAIDLTRDGSVYITNVLPWRPPQNRDPKPDEIAMMLPFLERHVALAAPDILILMGNISAQACLGKRGITRLRGTWTEAFGRPAMPMLHPAYLLRTPIAKRDTWADLLDVQARLKGQT